MENFNWRGALKKLVRLLKNRATTPTAFLLLAIFIGFNLKINIGLQAIPPFASMTETGEDGFEDPWVIYPKVASKDTDKAAFRKILQMDVGPINIFEMSPTTDLDNGEYLLSLLRLTWYLKPKYTNEATVGFWTSPLTPTLLKKYRANPTVSLIIVQSESGFRV